LWHGRGYLAQAGMPNNGTIPADLLISGCQTILQLIDRTHTDGDLYNRISGVFFLGCQHDERDEKFGYRTFRTLTKEFGNGNWDDLDAFLWKPRVEWIIATTARFRSLKLSFPVWTYYESKTMKVKVYGQDRKYQRIVRARSTYSDKPVN
jgi:hypothetical protein